GRSRFRNARDPPPCPATGTVIPLTWLNTRPDVDKSLSVESGRQTERREDLGILEHRIPADALGGDSEDLERVQLVSATDAPIGGETGLTVGRDRLQAPVRSGLLEDPLHEQAVVAAADEPVDH